MKFHYNKYVSTTILDKGTLVKLLSLELTYHAHHHTTTPPHHHTMCRTWIQVKVDTPPNLVKLACDVTCQANRSVLILIFNEGIVINHNGILKHLLEFTSRTSVWNIACPISRFSPPIIRVPGI